MVSKHGLSERRACRLTKMHRSTYQHKRKADDSNSVLRARMLEIAHERRRFEHKAHDQAYNEQARETK